MTHVRRSIFASLTVFAALLWLAGCDDAPAPTASGLPTIQMQIGRKQFTLEVAATRLTREKGLSERDKLASQSGMIFVFTDEQPRGFWMKNTRIGLDIVYLDKNGTIGSVHTMRPFDLNTTPSLQPAKYAIELNEGVARDLGLKQGDVIQIPANLPPATE